MPESPTPELVYFVAVSLDGFIAGPQDDITVFPVEGDQIEMIVREYPETLPAPARDALGVNGPGAHFDTVLMGWNTFAIGVAEGLDDPYPHLHQTVFSRTRSTDDAGPGVTVTSEDPKSVVRELKDRDGASNIWLCGGGELATHLWPEIDRLILKVNPIILGAGTPLVSGPVTQSRSLHLESSEPFRSGVVMNEYRLKP